MFMCKCIKQKRFIQETHFAKYTRGWGVEAILVKCEKPFRSCGFLGNYLKINACV